MNNTELREALELAALAMGFKVQDVPVGFHGQVSKRGLDIEPIKDAGRVPFINDWRPHTDDGDSRRLQVALGIDAYWSPQKWIAGNFGNDDDLIETTVPHGKDSCAALRIAVLRVAAEIGRRIKAEREGEK